MKKFCLYDADYAHLKGLCGGLPRLESAVVRYALRRLKRVSEGDLRQSLVEDGILGRITQLFVQAGDSGEEGVV